MNYAELLKNIKTRIRQAQVKAAMAANAEMLALYWDVGRMIDGRQNEEGWGKSVIPRLAKDIRNDLSQVKGFSERNMDRMLSFYREHSSLLISPLAVAKLEGFIAAVMPQAVAQLADTSETSGSISPPPVAKLKGRARKAIPAHAVPEIDECRARLNQLVLQLPWAHNVILI